MRPPRRPLSPPGAPGPAAAGPGDPARTRPGLRVTGEIIRGKTVRLGYLIRVTPGSTPRSPRARRSPRCAARSSPPRAPRSASQLLDRLGLRGDTQWTPAGELSGGERRRLQLLRILVDEPNVLFLDEPTNDLDVDTLTELEDLLDGWPGSLVRGQPRPVLPGAGDRPRGRPARGRKPVVPAGRDRRVPAPPLSRGRGRRRPAWRGGARPAAAGTPGGAGAPGGGGAGLGGAGAQRAARKEMQRLERQIDRLSRREEELTAALAAHATDYVRLTELGADLRAVQDEKARLEEQWLEAAEDV